MSSTNPENSNLSEQARRHLWMHFSRMGSYETHEVPVMVRGEGAYVWDQHGKRYLDGLAGLFTSQLGHGRTELAEAGAKQASTLAYFPLWTYAHPRAIELAERLAGYAPGDLNRIFFTSGGSEAVESAWKLARQYFRMTGQPQRTKVISRDIAYHGTTMGALSITGIPDLKTPFEPLVPGAIKVPNTNFYRAPLFADDEVAFGQWAADEIERAILREGANTVAAVYLEPVQNAGGCFPPPPGYFERVRQICDRHGVLLVSDEVICAFGRLGHWFGADRYAYQPDIITVAKGLTSGYAPLGAMIASDRLMEPFLKDGRLVPARLHLRRPPGQLRRRPGQPRRVRGRADPPARAVDRSARSARRSRASTTSRSSATSAARASSTASSSSRTSRRGSPSTTRSPSASCGATCPARCSRPVSSAGPTTAGDPVVQLSPPLICGQEEIDFMVVDPARGADRGVAPGVGGPRGARGRRYGRLSLWWDAIPDSAPPRPPLAGRPGGRRLHRRGRIHRPVDRARPRPRRSLAAYRRGGEGGGGLRGLGAQRRLVLRAVRHVRRRAGPAATASMRCGPCAGPCRPRSTPSVPRRSDEGIDCHFAKGGTVDAAAHRRPAHQGPGRDRRGPRRWASARSDLRWLDRARSRGDDRRWRGSRGHLHPALRRHPTGPPRPRPGRGGRAARCHASTSTPR